MLTNQARKLIADRVPWVKGKLFNYVTFSRLIDEKILPTVHLVERGQDVFNEEDVLKLISKFPPIEPPKRLGIVRWLQGERTKKELRKIKKGSGKGRKP